MNDKQFFVPAFTLIGPWEGDDTWTVTLDDYDSNNPYDVCTQRRFDTKEEAEAFIAESKPQQEKKA